MKRSFKFVGTGISVAVTFFLCGLASGYWYFDDRISSSDADATICGGLYSQADLERIIGAPIEYSDPDPDSSCGMRYSSGGRAGFTIIDVRSDDTIFSNATAFPYTKRDLLSGKLGEHLQKLPVDDLQGEIYLWLDPPTHSAHITWVVQNRLTVNISFGPYDDGSITQECRNLAIDLLSYISGTVLARELYSAEPQAVSTS